MKLQVQGYTEIDAIAAASTLAWSVGSPLRPPTPAFPGQDLRPLMRALPTASLTVTDDAVVRPLSELKLYTLANGLFLVGHGMDGAILNESGHPIHQTAVFCYANAMRYLENNEHDLPEPVELDEVFVGFDGAWRNYFHWICFAVPKAYLAAQALDPSVIIAMPDYAGALKAGSISYSEAAWRQSLDLSGLASRVTALPAGLYRARKLHFLWQTPREPTGIMYCPGFTDAFDAMAKACTPSNKPIDSVYLVRSTFVASRLEQGNAALVANVLERHGFETVQFEGCDLATQISIFANAKRVVSAHGAGLANTLFHRGGLKVLELNSDLDGHGMLRPWFYVTSAIRKHRYVMLDSTAAGLAPEHVEAAVAALDK
jgi:hypothetical protein